MIFSIDKETALVAERCHLVGTPSPVERRNFGETDSEVATYGEISTPAMSEHHQVP
jgi:hypothetical protein